MANMAKIRYNVSLGCKIKIWDIVRIAPILHECYDKMKNWASKTCVNLNFWKWVLCTSLINLFLLEYLITIFVVVFLPRDAIFI